MVAQDRLYRILEIVPATLTWCTFLGAIILSFVRPLWAIYFIIIFDTIWVLRVGYFVIYLVTSWSRFRRAARTDWPKKLNEIANWQRYYHIVFLPTYKEDLNVIRDTFNGLIQADFPHKNIIVVLAGEERDKENFSRHAEVIQEEFGDTFAALVITLHPQGLAGEIASKGSNLNWAGHKVKEIVDARAIPYENIIVSAFDIDTVVHPHYFASLTYTFATHSNPYRTSFQPIALYNNNIWDASAVMRVASFGTTFWLFTELAKPEHLFTFSSHAMSWRALVEVGFWEKDVVTEDSRIFVQCLLHYHGDYTVTPLYSPISMDTVTGDTPLHSLMNLYKQQRRWAWGIEHFPYMLWHFHRDKRIPLSKKISYAWNLGEGMYSWATAPILIFLLGRLPLVLLHSDASTTVLVANTPFILKWLMGFASAGIFLSVILSLLLLPPRPRSTSRVRIIPMILQWIMLPVTLILFGSIPATEAQTRLALGRYLGFSVTDKRH